MYSDDRCQAVANRPKAASGGAELIYCRCLSDGEMLSTPGRLKKLQGGKVNEPVSACAAAMSTT